MGCQECGGDWDQYCDKCKPKIDTDKERLIKILEMIADDMKKAKIW